MNRDQAKSILLSVALLFVMGFLVILLASFAHAQDWHVANSVPVEWDAVTTLPGGLPIPSEDTITYDVYLSNAISDPDKTSPTRVTTTPTPGTTYLITLTDEGKFFVGAQTVRDWAAGGETVRSVIGWSDDPLIVSADGPFGLKYVLVPEVGANLRIGGGGQRVLSEANFK